MKIAITGGGTGGHLSIAKALAHACVNDGNEVIFIGSLSGQDRAWFDNDDTDFHHRYFLKSAGVVNKKGIKKFLSIFNILTAMIKSLLILREEKISAVISVGGFSSAPASFAAIVRRTPLFIHEQNAVEGTLNKMLKSRARLFFSSYDKNSLVHSYPVNEKFFKSSRIRTELKTIIFLGGSQGARAINNLALEIAPYLQERHIDIIHQCGERDFERLKEAYKTLNIEVNLFAFSSELDILMQRADIAVSRSGASTLWELCANALPTFFVPYPYAAGDHQFHNANFIVRQELGWCERESDKLYENLLSALEEGIGDKSQRLSQVLQPNGAEMIINEIEKVVR